MKLGFVTAGETALSFKGTNTHEITMIIPINKMKTVKLYLEAFIDMLPSWSLLKEAAYETFIGLIALPCFAIVVISIALIFIFS
jgi:hypothetical protein